MHTLWNDVRFGFRLLRRSPTYSVIALLTLVLGIGANTLIFSMVNALTFSGPFRDSGSLVTAGNQYQNIQSTPASFPDFLAWREQSRAFDRLSAVYQTNLNFSGKGEPRRLLGAMISKDYFETFGVHARSGRLFGDSDQHKGSPPVCLISEALWREVSGSDPAIFTSSMTLDGTSYQIVGVLPADTPDFRAARKTEVWLPLEANPPFELHGTNYLLVLGRLKRGIGIDQARADLRLIQTRIDAAFPANKHDIAVTPLMNQVLGNARPALTVLIVTVAFVLLIACSNVANMVLARASSRSREIALREALGATRARLVRQLLTEHLILTTVAAVASVAVAHLLAGSLLRFWPSSIRRPDAIEIDWRVLVFTAAISIFSVLVFGLAPALRLSRLSIEKTLRETQGMQTTTGQRGNRLRNSFVVLEIAFSTVLLTTAVLTLRSFVSLLQVDPGFQPHKILTFDLSLPDKKYPQPTQISHFYTELLRRVEALPGVQSVGASSSIPLGGRGQTGDFEVKDRVYGPGQRPFAEHYYISPGYIETLKIPLIKGRLFTPDDKEDTLKVVVVNETTARQTWPDENPVGKLLNAGVSEGWQQVVGVVGDVKGDTLQAENRPQLYFSALQFPEPDMTIVVRSNVDSVSMTRAIKDLLYMQDPEQPITNVNFMENVIAGSISGMRSSTFLQGLLASLAMVLAVLGVYGVMAYSITQRIHEFGIRIALGAQRGSIMKMVIAGGVRLVVYGVLAGIAGSLIFARLLRSQLFGISAADPATYAIVTLLLLTGALLASYLPAYRATRVSPLMMLRRD